MCNLEDLAIQRLIQLPDGTNILIDAGDRFNSRYQELKSVLEQNNITTIHLAIATHKDSDHLGGFNHLLQDVDYTINEIWFSEPIANNTATVRNFYINADGLILYPKTGHTKTFGETTLEILSPNQPQQFDTDNANSIITLLEYDELEFLFTADATVPTEQWLIANTASDKLDIDIMNAPHHGGDTSSTPEFIVATSPELVIHSADVSTNRDDGKNRHGHPHDNVIDRYAASGISQLQTGVNGNINIQTDGTKCSVLFTNGTEIACFEGILKISEQDDNNQIPDQGTNTDTTNNNNNNDNNNAQTHTNKTCR